MNKKQLEQFEQLLLIQQNELLELSEVAEMGAETVELDQSKVGRLSRMDAMQSQAMSIETNRRRLQKLSNIKRALNKISNNDYGYCVDCDEAIAIQRLEINPETVRCIKCAALYEE